MPSQWAGKRDSGMAEQVGSIRYDNLQPAELQKPQKYILYIHYYIKQREIKNNRKYVHNTNLGIQNKAERKK